MRKTTSLVYVMRRADGLHKIGLTTIANFKSRKAHIEKQVNSPLTVVLTICNLFAPMLEIYLHRLFEAKQVHFEWYALDAADIQQLREMRGAHGLVLAMRAMEHFAELEHVTFPAFTEL